MNFKNKPIPSYWDIIAAYKYGLISDTEIADWAYEILMNEEEPDWWFSYLISAVESGNAQKYLREAARETDGGTPQISRGLAEPWFSFFAYITGNIELKTAYQNICYYAEYSITEDAAMLKQKLNEFWPKGDVSIKRAGKPWKSIFSDYDLNYVTSKIKPFLEYWGKDQNEILSRPIGDLGNEAPVYYC